MPSLNVRVDDDRALVRLDRVGPDARAVLSKALKGLVDDIASDARARAQAHIRFVGKSKYSPGTYVDSIHGGVTEKDRSLVGYVRSSHWLAHWMELGTKAHEILPKAAEILAFEGPAGMVFARHVIVQMQPYPAILPAFEAARGDIEGALETALRTGVAE